MRRLIPAVALAVVTSGFGACAPTDTRAGSTPATSSLIATASSLVVITPPTSVLPTTTTSVEPRTTTVATRPIALAELWDLIPAKALTASGPSGAVPWANFSSFDAAGDLGPLEKDKGFASSVRLNVAVLAPQRGDWHGE